MWRRALGVLLVILVIAGGVGVFLATYTPPPPAVAPVPVAEQVAAQQRITSAIEHPTPVAEDSSPSPNAAATPISKDVAIHFSQSDVNTLLVSNKQVQAHLKSAGVETARVAFEEPDRVRMQAWMKVQGSRRQVTVEGELIPNGAGGLEFLTQQTKIGLLPVPSGVAAKQIDDRAAKLLAQAVPNLPLAVQSVSVTNNQLTLTGPAKPQKQKRVNATKPHRLSTQ